MTQDGGGPGLEGMAMWTGGEIATLLHIGKPKVPAVGRESENALPKRVEQKLTIAALHKIRPEPAKPDGAIAQIVGLPAVLGYARCAKQRGGDFAVRGIVETPVEGAQRVNEVIPLRL